MRMLRLIKILRVALKYGLDEFLLGHERFYWLRPTVRTLTFWRDLSAPRAQRLRLALQDLGPIFVKFGQMLSTRRDLLPADIADELARLQDRVPPFPSDQVIATLQRVYGKPVDEVFQTFDRTPIASASVAQVHLATLPDGTPAAVKVLRPNIGSTIEKDLALMQTGAVMVEKLWSDGKRLKPREVVAEFDRTIHDELDLAREAANCSQLRRNFARSPLLLVPEVFWDWCNSEVMVMERMEGIPISRADRLVEQAIDLKQLARAGVEIFFTQVFRDGFFHADMHPGNIFVAAHGARQGKIHRPSTSASWERCPTPTRAISRRISWRFSVATTAASPPPTSSPAGCRLTRASTSWRLKSGRSVSRFSTGRSRKFRWQRSWCSSSELRDASTSRSSRSLVLLQKTLLNVEGLGRQLDPDLDLWVTAKPFLERWMRDLIGWRAFERRLRDEAPFLVTALPLLPRLLHARLSESGAAADSALKELAAAQHTRNRWLAVLAALLAGVIVLLLVRPL